MEDLEFIQRCVKADKEAWSEFLKQYSRLIYTYIYSVLNSKGYRLAQENINDIFQELLYSLIKDDYRKLRSFQGRNGCTLASWLRQVAINFTIDYTRRIKQTVSIDEEIGDDFTLKDILTDTSIPVSELLNNEERLRSLKECIDKLGNEDKLFLEIHINKGIRLQDIKNIFRSSRGSVDMQKSRIILRLRDCFKSKGFWLDS